MQFEESELENVTDNWVEYFEKKPSCHSHHMVTSNQELKTV